MVFMLINWTFTRSLLKRGEVNEMDDKLDNMSIDDLKKEIKDMLDDAVEEYVGKLHTISSDK